MNKYLFIFPLLFLCATVARCYLPVVCVPGAGDFTLNLLRICNEIKILHPGTEAIYLQPGGVPFSIFGMWNQITVYQNLFNAIFLKYPDGINIVSHSQGALITRTIIQSTANHPVKNWLSISGPLMGIYGIPFTNADILGFFNFSNLTRSLIAGLAYTDLIQDTISVAGYWNDPTKQEMFLALCKFLPIINNLVKHNKSSEYKTNFIGLNTTILFGGDGDEVIIPWQSTLGGFYDKDLNIVPLKDQDIYKNDTFGIRTLDERGSLISVPINGVRHLDITGNLNYTRDYFIKYLH